MAGPACRYRAHPLRALRAEAPAKLNLALALTGRRDDGYHTLRSVFVRLALHDFVEVQPSHDRDELVVVGDLDVPAEDNLVLRAAAELRAAMGRPLPALHFRLAKRIPAEAGLAGGSSDAAAALELAALAWDVEPGPAAHSQAALRLGADVPFFASGHAAAVVSGIGEHVEPLAAPDPVAGLLLVTPPEGLSTTAVFAELDRLPPPDGTAARHVDALAAAMGDGSSGADLSARAEGLRDANDLWPPARRLAPWLEPMRDALEASMRRPFLLTGSGATLFAILASAAEAAEAAERLRRVRPPALERATVVSTTTAIPRTDQEGGT